MVSHLIRQVNVRTSHFQLEEMLGGGANLVFDEADMRYSNESLVTEFSGFSLRESDEMNRGSLSSLKLSSDSLTENLISVLKERNPLLGAGEDGDFDVSLEFEDYEEIVHGILENNLSEFQELTIIGSDFNQLFFLVLKRFLKEKQVNSLIFQGILGPQQSSDSIRQNAFFISKLIQSRELFLLSSISLRQNSFTDMEAEFLSKSLQSCIHLISLDLQANYIGEVGCKNIGEMLKSNKTLCFLDLSLNDIGPEGVFFIADALEFNNSLESINLEQNNIGRKGAESVAKILLKNKSLKSISISSNRIGDEGSVTVAEALAKNSILHELRVNSNNISRKGAEAFAKAIFQHTSLTLLSLAANQIRDDGVFYISNAIQDSSIIALDLGSNSITDNGAVYISNGLLKAASLKSDCNLTSLDLSHNLIGNRGAKELYTSCTALNRIVKLILKSCVSIEDDILPETIENLTQQLEENRHEFLNQRKLVLLTFLGRKRYEILEENCIKIIFDMARIR
jgi:Ran GTPase-activating protein (RanGAP) involved in mRNA processing and transport